MRRGAFRAESGDGFFWGPVWWLALPVLAIIALIAIQTAAGFGYVSLGLQEILPSDHPGFLTFFLIAAFLPLTAVALLYARFVEERSFAQIGMAAEGALVRFFGGAVSGLAFVSASLAIMVGLGALSLGEVAPAFGSTAQLGWTLALLVGFIIQGGTEEVVFRGWLMSAFARKGGLVAAVLLNSALFGLLHASNIQPVNWIAVTNVVLVGVFLSLMAIYAGSIWSVCGWHAAWNWMLATGFEIEVSGHAAAVEAFAVDLDAVRTAPDWLTGGAFGPEGSVVVTGVLAVGTVGYLAALALRRKNDTAAA